MFLEPPRDTEITFAKPGESSRVVIAQTYDLIAIGWIVLALVGIAAALVWRRRATRRSRAGGAAGSRP